VRNQSIEGGNKKGSHFRDSIPVRNQSTEGEDEGPYFRASIPVHPPFIITMAIIRDHKEKEIGALIPKNTRLLLDNYIVNKTKELIIIIIIIIIMKEHRNTSTSTRTRRGIIVVMMDLRVQQLGPQQMPVGVRSHHHHHE
jgi:hypothetical protein